jgi:AcrR family transcriptional regulator
MLERIVGAATALVESEGFEGLAMRKVASRCGVGVMTLYGYVRTREELIAAVIDRYLADIPVPDVGHLSWQEQLAEVFRAVNRAFEAHPVLSEIAGHQSLDSLAFYRGAEVALRALKHAGLSDAETVGALDALTSFVVGFAQRKAERRLRSTQSAERLARIRALPDDEFRTVVELAGQLVTWDSDRHFEDGLQLVIGGIEQRVSAAPAGV